MVSIRAVSCGGRASSAMQGLTKNEEQAKTPVKSAEGKAGNFMRKSKQGRQKRLREIKQIWD